MEQAIKTNSNNQFTPFQRSLGGLTIIGILLSVSNELGSIDLYNPGVATVTRLLHAALGMASLLWVLFGSRIGLTALVLWIITALPFIGVDHSMEFVKSILEFKFTKIEQRTVQIGTNLPMVTDYKARGINWSPLLSVVWLFYCKRKKVFPLCGEMHSKVWLRRLNASLLASLIIVIAGGWAFAKWLLSPPYLILATEPGMSFYYQDEKIGGRFLRVTPELMNKVGLNGDLPPEEWIIFHGNPSPWGFGIFLDDGTCPTFRRKLISIKTDDSDPNIVRQKTPWGERAQPRRASSSEQTGQFRRYGMARNTDFHVNPVAPTEPVTSGETFMVNVTIDAKRELPKFANMRFSVVMHAYSYSSEEGTYPRRKRKAEAPPEFLKLNHQSQLTADLPIQAPYRPGVYSILLNGWLYDEDGEYAEPERTLGYSSYALITVVADQQADQAITLKAQETAVVRD